MIITAYIDTSALAKWYINEAHSKDFSAWIQKQDNTHISRRSTDFIGGYSRLTPKGLFNPEGVET